MDNNGDIPVCGDFMRRLTEVIFILLLSAVFVSNAVAQIFEIANAGTMAPHGGNGESSAPAISSDGSRIAFVLDATNLI